MRKSEIIRKTKETDIKLTLNVDGKGTFSGETGVGFFDHMLTSLTKYAGFDVNLEATGDLYVDTHHLIEDVGIVLGKAIEEAIGDKKQIKRFADRIIPMDDALVMGAIDISGRSYLNFDIPVTVERIGTFETECLLEFYRGLLMNFGATLHLKHMAGTNNHHIVEAVFKTTGMLLKDALSIDSTIEGVLSTKGSL